MIKPLDQKLLRTVVHQMAEFIIATPADEVAHVRPPTRRGTHPRTVTKREVFIEALCAAADLLQEERARGQANTT